MMSGISNLIVIEVFDSFHNKNQSCKFGVDDFNFENDVEDCRVFLILFNMILIYIADLMLRIPTSNLM